MCNSGQFSFYEGSIIILQMCRSAGKQFLCVQFLPSTSTQIILSRLGENCNLGLMFNVNIKVEVMNIKLKCTSYHGTVWTVPFNSTVKNTIIFDQQRTKSCTQQFSYLSSKNKNK